MGSGLLCFRESGLPGRGDIQQRLHQTPAMRRGLLGEGSTIWEGMEDA